LNKIFKPAVDNIENIVELLFAHYPDATRSTLINSNAFQLLIATILAAQSTDKMVNTITPGLFKKYKDPEAFASADPGTLEQDIKKTGFFRNKAKSIMGASAVIAKDFGGKVPQNMEGLITLPGVGRKTANVVLGEYFDKQVIVVDTHMKRISNLIGLTVNTNPDKIEKDLAAIVPNDKQTGFSHRIVEHGRTICIARRPDCSQCPILRYCRYGLENN